MQCILVTEGPAELGKRPGNPISQPLLAVAQSRPQLEAGETAMKGTIYGTDAWWVEVVAKRESDPRTLKMYCAVLGISVSQFHLPPAARGCVGSRLGLSGRPSQSLENPAGLPQ